MLRVLRYGVRFQRARLFGHVGTCDLPLNGLQVLGVCLSALLVGDYIEGYSLSFVECCQAGLLDGGDVNENVGRSIVKGDETKAPSRIEELHRTNRHYQSPWF